jgi:hypothetical protein
MRRWFVWAEARGRRSIALVALAAGLAICAIAGWLVADRGQVRAAGPALTPAFTATPTSTIAVPSAGLAGYAGMASPSATFNLPFIEAVSGPAPAHSVIHVFNATGQATDANVTFFNLDGSVAVTTTLNLGVWATAELDVAQLAPPGFIGSAMVSAATPSLSVTVNLLSSQIPSDNIATYPGVPTQSITSQTLLPQVLKNYYGFDTSLTLENISTAPTTATITFFNGNAPPSSVTSPAIPSNGGWSLDLALVSSLPPGWEGQATITTTTAAIAAVGLTAGPGFFDVNPSVGGGLSCGPAVQQKASTLPSSGSMPLLPATASLSRPPALPSTLVASSAAALSYIPLVADSAAPAGAAAVSQTAATGFAIFNPACVTANVAVEFYEPDSLLVLTTNTVIQPGQSYVVFAPAIQGLPVGFAGSAVVASDQPVVVTVNDALLSSGSSSDSAGDSYLAPGIAAPIGTQAALPELFNGLNGFSSSISLMNVSFVSATYPITYLDTAGNQIGQSSVTLAPNGSITISLDNATVPPGFVGSALITSLQNAPFAAVVHLIGAAPVAPTPTATSTPVATATFTPTVVATPTPPLLARQVVGRGAIPGTGAGSDSTFTFSVTRGQGGAPTTGSLTYEDSAESLHFQSTAISSLVNTGATAAFAGTGKVNGNQIVSFVALVEDNSTTGASADTFAITLSSDYSNSGTLTRGNISIR